MKCTSCGIKLDMRKKKFLQIRILPITKQRFFSKPYQERLLGIL